ncbi:MAG: NTP transferase domain-containing protein [Acidobacteria bacterium]|nr:NTP transferase domain-containing protein [Acidobacteriota bacterium]
MKGIILAGGLGTRLRPLTKVTNKHLLPVFNKPMIFYPLETLVNAGIQDIMVVTGGNNAGDFLRLLGNGKDFGLRHLHFAYQEGEGGIAEALSLAENFADNDLLCVMLGDNLIEKSIRLYVERFKKQGCGARIILKEVTDPQRFGVPRLEGDAVVEIEEKPAVPASKYAVTGIYLYDHRVFDIIKTLKPSARGELEITDVNNQYIRWGQMRYDILDGWWTDAGTIESLLRASNLVAEKERSQSQALNPQDWTGESALLFKFFGML